MNLEIWQKPPKVVCRDCGVVAYVSSAERLLATDVIEAWNALRLANKNS
jgi:hypothetical protein